MTHYRKKPVVIEAWHWLYRPEQEKEPEWVNDALWKYPDVGGISFEPEHVDGPRIMVVTLEGPLALRPGGWLIRGVKGELYPCDDDIFAMTYEPVDQAPKGQP